MPESEVALKTPRHLLAGYHFIAPVLVAENRDVRYDPLYDLVNTRVLLAGDLFALPLNGKENYLRLGDFQKLAARWGLSRKVSGERVTDLADRALAHVDDVLESASQSDEMTESYRRIVLENVEGL